MISLEYRRRPSLPSSSFFTFPFPPLASSSFISTSRQNSPSRKSPPSPPSPSSRFSTTPFYSLFSFLSILTALNPIDIAQAQPPVPPSSSHSSSFPFGTDNNNNSNSDDNRNDRNNNSDIDPNLMAAAALSTSSGGRQTHLSVQSSTTTINVITQASTLASTISTTAPLSTTTTTTIRTFSDHIITVDVSTSTSSGVVGPTTAVSTEKPYGWTDDKNTNGGLMLTVSLVVVFVVLTGLILVVFCLFRRRSAQARRQMRQLSKGASSSSVLENGHSTAAGGKTGTMLRDGNNRHSFSGIRGTSGSGSRSSGIFLASGGAGLAGSNASQNGSGIGTPRTGSNYGTSEIDINRALQEMSELHQSHRLSKRSSNLSLGHSRMLSPVMSAAAVAGARPPSLMGSGYYSGSNSGTPGGPGADSNSRANSFVMGGGSSSTGTGGGGDSGSGHLLESSSSSRPQGEFRSSQYDEQYGRVSPLPQPHDYQQQQEFMQESSPQLLGTGQDDVASGSVQITDRVMSPTLPLPPAPQVHVHPLPLLNRSTGHLPMHGERPHSMMVAPQSSSNLVIPPSITTRRRSMMNTNSMYVAQAGQRPPSFLAQQQQSAYYTSPPPPPQFFQQQQQQQHLTYPLPPQPYQSQQYDYVDSPSESSPAMTNSTQRGPDEGSSSTSTSPPATTVDDVALHSTGKLEPKREEDGDDGMEAEDIGAGVGSGSPSSLLLGAGRRSLTLTSDADSQPEVVITSPLQTKALPDTKASVTTTGPSATGLEEVTNSSTIHPA